MVDNSTQRHKSKIFMLSLGQVMAWLAREYKVTTGDDAAFHLVGNRAGLREVEAKVFDPITKQRVKLAYPFGLLVIADISLDADKAGFKRNRATNGIMTGRNLDTGMASFEQLRPVKVGLGLNFRTDSLDTILDLAHIIINAAPKVSFFMQGDNGFIFETSLAIDGSLSIPETNWDSPGEGYQFELPLILNTYMGFSAHMRLIKTVKVSYHEEESGREATIYEGKPFDMENMTFNFKDYFDETHRLYTGYKAS